MLANLKRKLSLAGSEPKPVEVENTETGCKGTTLMVPPGSQPGSHSTKPRFRYEGPFHTDKCRCLNDRDIPPAAFKAHLSRVISEGLVTPEERGVLTLSLLLRIPVLKDLEPPVDKSLRLVSGEEFPECIKPESDALQSFPPLDETNM